MVYSVEFGIENGIGSPQVILAMTVGQSWAQGINRGMVLAIKGQFAGRGPATRCHDRVGPCCVKLISKAVDLGGQLTPATQSASGIQAA